KAIAGVNGKEVDGRTLAVDWAVDKDTWDKMKKENPAEDGDGEARDEKTDEVDEDELMPDIEGETSDADPNTESEHEATGSVEADDIDDDGSEDLEDEQDEHEDESKLKTLFIRNLP